MRQSIHILRNFFKPSMAKEMLNKIQTRIKERRNLVEIARYISYCDAEYINVNDWARIIDEDLWAESVSFSESQDLYAAEQLSKYSVSLGGGGFHSLIYFLTRLTKPEVVVETGVAAGFSSRAFLVAINKNGVGKLYSSDFPYVRLKDPEQYIGVLVEEELRKDWTLLLEGDRKNLPAICKSINSIDLVHYDSDKSVAGRNFALKCFENKFTNDSIVIFDDIQDNLHFAQYSSDKNSLIFKLQGKYVGCIFPDNWNSLYLYPTSK